MIKIIQLVVLLFLLTDSGAQYKTRFAGMPKNIATPEIVLPPGTDPYTSIRCSLQDKAGNLWFGTTGAGVYRYNGAFTNFTKLDGLSSNIVYCMLEDSNGNIWVGTANGVCRFDGKGLPLRGEGFIGFPIPGIYNATNFLFNTTYPNVTPIPYTKSVFSMIQDKKGSIWFGTGQGLCRYDINQQDPDKAFTSFQHNNTWQTCYNRTATAGIRNAVQSLLEDDAGNIWLSTIGQGGAWRFDGKTFTHLAPDAPLKSRVSCMAKDKAGNIWFGTGNHGIYKYDGSTFTYFTETNGPGSNNVTSILADTKGNIWFSSTPKGNAGRTQGWVTRYDGKTFTQFPLPGLNNTSIWNITEDKKGHIWFGSRNVGLYRYDGKSFTDFSGIRDGC